MGMRRLLPFLLLPLAACGDRAGPGSYDLLIAGGTVVDGTGAPAYRADVAVRDGRIVRVSRDPLPATGAARVIDATGRVVAPGFIDLHTHIEPLPRLPAAQSHVRQGVTTAVGGPDGGGPLRLGAYLDSLEATGIGLNVAYQVGHNSVRRQVLGMEDRAPTAEELAQMEALVAQAMEEGAFGLSTGLKYPPGAFARVDEVIALARVAAGAGGFYSSHLREEGLGLIEAVAEAIEIGRRADLPVLLTHHKVVGQPMWGASERTLAMVDEARRQGLDIVIDQYPYTASHTGIGILVPTWAMAGGDSAFVQRTRDPLLRDSIVRGLVDNIRDDRGGGDLRRVQFSRVGFMPELEGRTLDDWAKLKGMESSFETGAELVIEAISRGGASAIYHVMDDADLERIMRHPQTMIASDGGLAEPGQGHPHPRAYGTFPRVLGHYVRDRGVLPLESAVHKMTGQPAALLGLADRGAVAEGMAADLVVFDPATVADRATFEDPHQYPAGIEYVLVNGAVTVGAGEYVDARAGQVLRRSRSR
jgi:N-acyl-D-amino-acid deacylase